MFITENLEHRVIESRIQLERLPTRPSSRLV